MCNKSRIGLCPGVKSEWWDIKVVKRGIPTPLLQILLIRFSAVLSRVIQHLFYAAGFEGLLHLNVS